MRRAVLETLGAGAAAGEEHAFRTLALLGKGSSGRVFKAVDASGRCWALKLKARPSDEDILREEAALMQTLSHPNLIWLKEAVVDEAGKCVGIAMPLATCTLADRMKSVLSGACLMRYLAGLQRALSYLHALQLVHMDVKPLNVFVFGRTAVLGDLGSVHRCGETIQGLYGCTRPYRPPEVLFGCTRAHCAMDAWSYGVLALETSMQKEIPFGKGGVEQAQLVVAMLGPPKLRDFEAMMAPWHRVPESVGLALEEAGQRWKSDGMRAAYWEHLKARACCGEAFALAEALLVYDSQARRIFFEGASRSVRRRVRR